MVLVAYAGPVRPAAALRDSVLCLPTDIHSLFVNKPSSSSSSSSSSSCHHVCRGAEVEDYQHVERSCIPFARTRTFPLTRWRVRQKVNTRRACSSDTAPARLPPCTQPTPSRAHSRERGPAAAAAVASAGWHPLAPYSTSTGSAEARQTPLPTPPPGCSSPLPSPGRCCV